MGAMRLFGTMKTATKSVSAGIYSQYSTEFAGSLDSAVVIGILEFHTCAISLIASATPSWFVAS